MIPLRMVKAPTRKSRKSVQMLFRSPSARDPPEDRKGADPPISLTQGEEPEPSGLATNTTHVKDTVRKELGRSLTELVAEVEDHDTLSRLASGVPGGQGPETTRNEARLGDTEQESSGDEGAIVVLESLEGGDGTEEEELESEPLAGTDPVEDHVGGNLEQHNTEGQHLLTNVELILGDLDILEEAVGESVGNIATIKFCCVQSVIRSREVIRVGFAVVELT